MKIQMKKYPDIILIAFAALLICTGLVLHLKPVAQINSIKPSFAPMPVYQGRTAAEWLDQVFTSNQADALTAFKEMGTNALPVLVETFSQETNLIRWDAADYIAVKMPYAKAALPDFIRLLANAGADERSFLLGPVHEFISSKDTNAVPILIDCLDSQNVMTRLLAALSLGRIGRGAHAAIPALTPMLNEPLPSGVTLEEQLRLQMSVAWVIWKINQETNATSKTLQYVIDNSTDAGTRAAALVWLSEIRSNDVALIEPIIWMLADTNSANEMSLAKRIGDYGPKAKAAVPSLIPLLNATNVELRAAALKSLKEIDPETAAKYENR